MVTDFFFLRISFTFIFSTIQDFLFVRLNQWKDAVLIRFSDNNAAAFFLWIFLSAIYASLSAISVYYISPHAAGSGLPEMKSVISGVSMKHYLSFRTIVAKMVGLIGGFASGLSIGRIGPYSHICSIIASQMMELKVFHKLKNNNSLRLSMIACGCSVAVAIAMGAPLGGVLYAIEVTSSFYNMQHLWKSFYCAMCGSLTVRLLGYGLNAYFSTKFNIGSYTSNELFAFALMSIILGFLGVLFIVGLEKLGNIRKKYKILAASKYPQIVITAVITAALAFPLVHLRNSYSSVLDDLFNSGPMTWAPNLIFVRLPFEFVLKFSLTSKNQTFSLIFSFIITPLKTVVALGLPLPCGLFGPLLITGAIFGRLFGEILKVIFPNSGILPGGYAVVGAAAFAGGITRSISTAVVVLESTGQLYHATPVLLSVLITCAIGNAFCPSVFDKLIQIKKLPFMPNFSTKTAGKTVDEFMETKFAFVSKSTTYNQVVAILGNSKSTSALPVVETHSNMIFLGTTPAEELIKLLHAKEKLFERKVKKNLRKEFENARNSPEGFNKEKIIDAFKEAFRNVRKHDSAEIPEYGTVISDSENSVDYSDEYTSYREMFPLSLNREEDSLFKDLKIEEEKRKKRKKRKVKGTKDEKKPILGGSAEIPNLERRNTLQMIEGMEEIKVKYEETAEGIEMMEMMQKDLKQFLQREKSIYFQDNLREDLLKASINACAFQIVSSTALSKAHFLFSMLSPKVAYITKKGALVGIVTKDSLVRFLL